MTTRYRYRTASGRTWEKAKPKARELRKKPTPAQDALWQAVRNNALGVRFRREHVIVGYYADLVCLSRKLVVEVDGPVHDDPDRQAHDAERTDILEEHGFRVIRFRNEQVLKDLKGVLAALRKALEHTTSGT